MNVVTRNIPNALTCCNVAAGVLSIIMASHGSAEVRGLPAYNWAWIFIGIAAVADFLDGFAARLLHAYSELGKELDSLCDLVSFGVAPAILMYHALCDMAAPAWLPWCVVVIPVAGALRLARFNIDTRQTTNFIGLPIPANAIFWIGYSAMLLGGNLTLAAPWLALPVMIIESWLMLSPLRLFSLKFKTWGWRSNEWRWILIVTAIVCCVTMGVSGLMWLIVAYLLYGVFSR
ncbi:MAG: CDP-diacylglycerol--serine O-phosphatidyltransferase [Muribaculaceae bacterium]|nr:CDP-diacylglycerol--serine O-phosphatidyltransferase [Muribaculaceae bacterium]